MLTDELNCALMIEQLPEAFPAVVGAKLTVNVTLVLGASVKGRGTPPIAKPGPMALTWEMVIGRLPEFVAVKLWLLVDPTWTLPKVTAAGLMLRVPKLTFVGLELGLALVMPAHPDNVATANSTISKLS